MRIFIYDWGSWGQTSKELNRMTKLRVAVLMGGKSPEHEVSLATGAEVIKNLNKKKYQIFPIVLSRKQTFSSQIIDCRPDVVFIAMHGPFGEDGTIQGMLELAGIPYTGAGVLASALGMDKPMFRKIMTAEGIPIPECVEISSKIKFPVVVKPSSQGSSVGVSIVRAKKDLPAALKEAFKFGPRVIIEKYLPGMEVTCGVLGNENPIALPVVEILPRKEFFDYSS